MLESPDAQGEAGMRATEDGQQTHIQGENKAPPPWLFCHTTQLDFPVSTQNVLDFPSAYGENRNTQKRLIVRTAIVTVNTV